MNLLSAVFDKFDFEYIVRLWRAQTGFASNSSESAQNRKKTCFWVLFVDYVAPNPFTNASLKVSERPNGQNSSKRIWDRFLREIEISCHSFLVAKSLRSAWKPSKPS